MQEAEIRRITFQAGLDKKQDLISKIARAKRAGVMAQAVEYLPCKSEALSSNPSNTKKKKYFGHQQING
jgi:hypothetical protein